MFVNKTKYIYILPDVHCAAILLLFVALRNNCLQEVLKNSIVESSLPMRVIDAEASKRWLESAGISKKDVFANQQLLDSMRKKKLLPVRPRKSRERSTSKFGSQSQSQSRRTNNSNNSNNSNSNSNRNLRPTSQDEDVDVVIPPLQQAIRDPGNLAAQITITTVKCDECGRIYPLNDGEELDEDEFTLCPTCNPFL